MIQFSSVTQLSPTLCESTDCSTPSLPVHHQPGIFSNTCPLSQWCHPTISSSVVPFSSCPQSLPASESFQMSQLFVSSSLSIGVSASTSVLPMRDSGLISLKIDWLDLLAVQGALKSHLQHHSSKVSIHQHLAFFIVKLLHSYMTTGKIIALTRQTFVNLSSSKLSGGDVLI